MIPVTKPFLPPMEEYQELLKGIWDRNWLTNNGPLVNELELRLKQYLNLDHLLFLSNGTIAIQIAIKALELKGEVITTPFSYIATTSSVVWEGCQPVFADIDKETFNISPESIEKHITDKTSAILATHVYGNPCDVEAIDTIAKKYNLKVIYDAAHAFGVKFRGKSIFEYGDISTTSFHATKLFHTVEGGAVITRSPELLKKMAFLMNFGHDGPEKFVEVGINGKNSELHAAMGLCNLSHVEKILKKRKEDYLYYQYSLQPLEFISQKIHKETEYNYSYFPVVFNSEADVVKVMHELGNNKIFARRYFYPTLDVADYLETSSETSVAKDIASKVLCLPLYYTISKVEIDMICRIIKRSLRYN